VPEHRSTQRSPYRFLVALLLVALTFAGVACSGSDGGGNNDDATPSDGSAPQTGADDSFTIWAPSTLQKPVDTIVAKFEKRREDIDIEVIYGSGDELTDRLLVGERPDLFVGTAKELSRLADEGTIPEEHVALGSDLLQIIVAPGNPKNITDVAVFGLDPFTTSGLCDAGASCGRAARQLLTQSGVSAAPDTVEPRPPALIDKVAGGQVDAGIIYRSQAVKAVSAGEIAIVTIPTAGNVQVDYWFAIIERGGAVDAFVKFLDNTDSTLRALQQAGLAPADGSPPDEESE
jgi:molybdate transport system substrate-binding protein